MEAIILAGGKAERLGDSAEGRPKALVTVAGRPLAAYQIALLARAGVDRVVVSCASGQEHLFEEALQGVGPEIVAVGEPEPLGRGGGLRFAAARRRDRGAVFAVNGDELVDLDLRDMLAAHTAKGGAATVLVAPLKSHLGVVELDDADVIHGFREAPRLPYWVNAGIYVLEEEALSRFPERGDHETTTFPELAAERRLLGYRYEGVWLTVNTPKDLRVAREYVEANPERFTWRG